MPQYYKSIYFNDFPAVESKGKSLTIAFNEKELDIFHAISNYSNEEIRELIGIDSYSKLNNIAEKEERSINQIIKRRIRKQVLQPNQIKKGDVTFTNSKSIPLQNWYPYIEGYSPDFVKYIINNYCDNPQMIYDPFAGTGTTIFAANEFSINTVYSEINPLLVLLINTKLDLLKLTNEKRKNLASTLFNISKSIINDIEHIDIDFILENNYKILFKDSKYFHEDTFRKILKISNYIEKIRVTTNELTYNLLQIAVISSLLPCSFLKKAGDVRFRTINELKNDPPEFIDEVLPKKISNIANDVNDISIKLNSEHHFLFYNSKYINYNNNFKIDTIITSPPYLNGTNYFRNTKLELWFLKYIQFENDLRYFRDQALTSGINDVSKHNNTFNNIKNIINKSPLLNKTIAELEKHSYDNRIPVMAESYFAEMADIFSKLQYSLKKGAKLFIDIGDSIFSDVHIQTDNILIEVLENIGYKVIEKTVLRKRRSRNKNILSQSLLFLINSRPNRIISMKNKYYWEKAWLDFKTNLPHQKTPFSKRNWGHPNHSLCSYQGKLKPSIAHNLVNIFSPSNGTILDPFCGVGTIPFEASLNGRKSYGIDLSLPAYYISYAKITKSDIYECNNIISSLSDFIGYNNITEEELDEVENFGFNKNIVDYYEKKTLKEIILSRRFFKNNPPKSPSEMLVISSLLHILHGNRPYALSRRSHPIVPYAPTGVYEYKSLIDNLRDKVYKTIESELPENFTEGKIFLQDSTKVWPQEINNLDAVITSPPFFDSTRFYLANWIRIWFSGWSKNDFKNNINSFVEERQKIDFSVYDNIFRQARERLKTNGVFVMHLGKSIKCDMAEELLKICTKWFNKYDLFDESVIHCESHGIKDKGTVTSHQYLILL